MTDQSTPIQPAPSSRRRAPPKKSALMAEVHAEEALAQTEAATSPVEAAQDAATVEPVAKDKAVSKPVKAKKKDKAAEKVADKASHKKHKKNKEPVIIRFEDEHLVAINARADALGLSRAAWVRMVVAKALAE